MSRGSLDAAASVCRLASLLERVSWNILTNRIRPPLVLEDAPQEQVCDVSEILPA